MSNELVHFQVLFAVGAVVRQLPMMILFLRVPMHRIIQIMGVLLGAFTLLRFRVQSYGEMAAYWVPRRLLRVDVLPRCTLRAGELVQE